MRACPEEGPALRCRAFQGTAQRRSPSGPLPAGLPVRQRFRPCAARTGACDERRRQEPTPSGASSGQPRRPRAFEVRRRPRLGRLGDRLRLTRSRAAPRPRLGVRRDATAVPVRRRTDPAACRPGYDGVRPTPSARGTVRPAGSAGRSPGPSASAVGPERSSPVVPWNPGLVSVVPPGRAASAAHPGRPRGLGRGCVSARHRDRALGRVGSSSVRRRRSPASVGFPDGGCVEGFDLGGGHGSYSVGGLKLMRGRSARG
jgi:hypothetical protein